MGERADTLRCRKIADDESMRRYRPVVDSLLDVVLIDCNRCHAQDTDPQGLWRPARIVPRGRRVTRYCTACGWRSER